MGGNDALIFMFQRDIRLCIWNKEFCEDFDIIDYNV